MVLPVFPLNIVSKLIYYLLTYLLTLSVFFGIVRFFPENIKIFFFNFFMFSDRMDVEKPQRVPLSVFWHCETLARQRLALAGPGAPLGPFF